MRVLHVITRMILGGAQENTLLTCEDLQALFGDEVLLVTGPPLGPEGSLLERAQRNRVRVAIVGSLRRAINPLRDWQSYRALQRTIREFQPDVVHTHSAKGGLLGRAAAWSLRVPAVIHGVHGAPFHPYQPAISREFFRRCERWAAQRCHALISVADAMTELLASAGVAPREKFTTIYSGMEVEPFLRADEHRARMRQALGYSPTDVVVGKIARLFHLKGHEYLIAAAQRIAADHPTVKFLLVGDGLLREELQRQIEKAQLGERFRFAGLVAPEEIPDYLSAMDIVVHASLREGLARVLPQALLAGKPVVSYDIDGAREVVLPGQTGYLLPPQSVEPLAAAVGELAESPALRERLGAAGRELCSQRFRHETMTAQIRALYERVLQQAGDKP